MGNTPTLSIELIPAPCPFCDSDNVAVLRTEGLNDDVLVNYCRTCEQEWPERVELPTVHQRVFAAFRLVAFSTGPAATCANVWAEKFGPEAVQFPLFPSGIFNRHCPRASTASGPSTFQPMRFSIANNCAGPARATKHEDDHEPCDDEEHADPADLMPQSSPSHGRGLFST